MASEPLQEQLGTSANWELMAWAGFFIGANVDIATCPVCGSLVGRSSAETHYNWHVALGQ